MDILEISYEIFTKPVQPKHSIQLDFSDFDLTTGTLFKELLIMFTEGMKILFGDSNGRVELSKLTQEDFFKIKEYFNSFGIDITYYITTTDDVDTFNRYNSVEKEHLKNYYLRLVSNENGMAYYISFDTLF